MAANLWGDGSLWGDGDLWVAFAAESVEHIVEKEQQCHRLSLKVTYTASPIPGVTEAFNIHDVRVRLSKIRQGSYTYETFVDATTPSERLGIRVSHAGSEFIISNMQLLASRKQHQPKG